MDSVVLLVVVVTLKEIEGNQAVENLRRLIVVGMVVVSEADDVDNGDEVVMALEVFTVEGISEDPTTLS